MGKRAVSSVLGRAMVDATFAADLKSDPVKAANTIGVHLGPNEVKAIKDIDLQALGTVGKTIRDKFGQAAFLDQQQQQQAKMD